MVCVDLGNGQRLRMFEQQVSQGCLVNTAFSTTAGTEIHAIKHDRRFAGAGPQ